MTNASRERERRERERKGGKEIVCYLTLALSVTMSMWDSKTIVVCSLDIVVQVVIAKCIACPTIVVML